jgi:anti-anti-sigma regulatory factor
VKVEFHRAADAEVRAAAIFYEDRVPGLGEQFLTEAACSRLGEHQAVGPRLDPEHRRFGLRRFPFALGSEGVRIVLKGRTTAYTAAPIWSSALETLARNPHRPLIIDASQVEYADNVGIALLLDLIHRLLLSRLSTWGSPSRVEAPRAETRHESIGPLGSAV